MPGVRDRGGGMETQVVGWRRTTVYELWTALARGRGWVVWVACLWTAVYGLWTGVVEAADPSCPTEGGIIWAADQETGDLSQWLREACGHAGESAGGSFDSGDCTRPPTGVTTDDAHSGRYAMKMSMGSGGGCRQFRKAESRSGNSYYYSHSHELNRR
jgi:hypothetical protein